MDNKNRVYKIVSQIPIGKVATYGQIAKMAGIKSPRVVGNILHKNPDPQNIPCHRVVSARGLAAKKYAFGGEAVQIIKLKAEGLKLKKNKIDLKVYQWRPMSYNGVSKLNEEGDGNRRNKKRGLTLK